MTRSLSTNLLTLELAQRAPATAQRAPATAQRVPATLDSLCKFEGGGRQQKYKAIELSSLTSPEEASIGPVPSWLVFMVPRMISLFTVHSVINELSSLPRRQTATAYSAKKGTLTCTKAAPKQHTVVSHMDELDITERMDKQMGE